MDGSPITLVIAEELTLVREGFAELCRRIPDCVVVGQCGDGSEALTLIHRLRPTLALLDLNLGVVHSLEVIHRLRESGSATRFIILSTRRDRRTAVECMRAAGNGFILKSGPVEDLRQAIEQAAAGAVFVSSLVEIDRISSNGDDRDPLETLSTREHQVFSLLIEGVRAKEIAARLDLSPKTVDTYRASLMRKLDIHDVAGLVKFAIHRELTSARQ